MKFEITADEMSALHDALEDFMEYTSFNLSEGEWYHRSHFAVKTLVNKLSGTRGKDCTLIVKGE